MCLLMGSTRGLVGLLVGSVVGMGIPLGAVDGSSCWLLGMLLGAGYGAGCWVWRWVCCLVLGRGLAGWGSGGRVRAFVCWLVGIPEAACVCGVGR